ncbi:KUP/HAK/KT family potassium transporter [Candidatus Saccharibacteria bacterium]|nr:KUP/HAK/KT family potassium transporter [Candidatus Saccharibacteria bacterium]
MTTRKKKSRRIPLSVGLAIGALGVAFGDIGTSPLYTINALFYGIGQTAVTHNNILGGISLIFWILTLVVTVKYIIYVFRASYQGEGGVLALRALVASVQKRSKPLLLIIMVFASTLLLSDGFITPAISVLSAVEGLNVATSFFTDYTVPIAAIILTILFTLQRKGTHKIGKIFGPVMVIWFVVIGALGLHQIILTPGILAALNPYYAFEFIGNAGLYHFMIAMGAIVLATTGGESMYADLGHFGKKPIRQGWFYLAYWMLILNYVGQGAYLLSGQPVISGNVFFSLVPTINLPLELTQILAPDTAHIIAFAPIYFMVVLATISTVIASQALITGAFSLTSQAMALDMIPKLNIVHTHRHHKGQIYIPAINWILLIGCLVLVFFFQSSSNLTDAYGLAVSGVMLSTTLAMFQIAKYKWKWPTWRTWLIFGTFLVIDATLLASTSLKLPTGGYVPVGMGLLMFAIVIAWNWGRDLVRSAHVSFMTYASHRDMAWLVNAKRNLMRDREYVEQERERKYVELDRAVVFLVSRPVTKLTDNIPIILRIFMKRHGAMPKHIIFLTIIQEKRPFVAAENRIKVVDFDYNIMSVTAHYGFMQAPDGLDILHTLKRNGYIGMSLHRCTVEASEEEVFVAKTAQFIDKLRVKVYLFFKRISPGAWHYFQLDTKPGLSKTVIPIVLGKQGWRIEIPEFALEAAEEYIDPDTRKPTSIQFGRPRSR